MSRKTLNQRTAEGKKAGQIHYRIAHEHNIHLASLVSKTLIRESINRTRYGFGQQWIWAQNHCLCSFGTNRNWHDFFSTA